MDRQTLRDRVHRCNLEGVEGLFNRGGGGSRRAAGNEWNGLPRACWLPPGAAPGVRKSRVLPGGDGLWVLCAAPSNVCVPIFLHFVSFRIYAADNRLQPFRKFFFRRVIRNEMALPAETKCPPETRGETAEGVAPEFARYRR